MAPPVPVVPRLVALLLLASLAAPFAGATDDPSWEELGCVVTPGGWGAPPEGQNPGALLHEHFDEVFPEGLYVGGWLFADAESITNVMPLGSDPLFNHAISLTLNLAFGDADLLSGDLETVVIVGGEYDGQSSFTLLVEAYVALADPERTTSDYSSLIDALTQLNEGALGCGEGCPEGQMPDWVGGCVPICPEDQVPDWEGGCVPLCPEGEMPEGDECFPVCPEGEMPGEDGCVPECPAGQMPGSGGQCVPASPPPTLPCPANVQAQALEAGNVGLTWSAVAGAQGYHVYRMGGGSTAWTKVATVNGTSYTDVGLEVGATYSYRVTAFSGGVESQGCASVQVTAVPFFGGGALAALAAVGAVGAYVVLRRKA